MIVTQNGELINPNYVERIYYTEGNVYARTVSSFEYLLGEYKDEEEARWAIRFMSKFINIEFTMPTNKEEE